MDASLIAGRRAPGPEPTIMITAEQKEKNLIASTLVTVAMLGASY